MYTHVHICTAVLSDDVDPWLLSEQSAEELLLPERILGGGHRGDEGVVEGVRVTVRHQVSCCLWYLQIGDDLPQITLFTLIGLGPEVVLRLWTVGNYKPSQQCFLRRVDNATLKTLICVFNVCFTCTGSACGLSTHLLECGKRVETQNRQ